VTTVSARPLRRQARSARTRERTLVLIAAAVVVGVATWVVLRGFSVVLSVAAVVACLTLMVAAYLLGGEREQRRSSGLLYVAAAWPGCPTWSARSAARSGSARPRPPERV